MSDYFKCVPVGLDFLEQTKNVHRAEQVIRATPEQIFEVFEDEVAWTVWVPPIQRVEWTSPKPFGIGTTRTVYMVGDMVGYEEFIAWEPGKRMAFTFIGCSKDNTEKFLEDYRVEDLGDGTCRVVWYMAMESPGGPSWSDAIRRPLMTAFNRWMFRRFRKYAEEYALKASTSSVQTL